MGPGPSQRGPAPSPMTRAGRRRGGGRRGSHLSALGGRSACGGGWLAISGAHCPPGTPFAAQGLGGATATALRALYHALPSLPLHLEEAAATSAFPLRLLAPAARGVPGGLIKFDLFFFRQSSTPRRPGALRPLPPSPAPGAALGRVRAPRAPGCGPRPGRLGGGVAPAAELGGGGVSGAPRSP